MVSANGRVRGARRLDAPLRDRVSAVPAAHSRVSLPRSVRGCGGAPRGSGRHDARGRSPRFLVRHARLCRQSVLDRDRALDLYEARDPWLHRGAIRPRASRCGGGDVAVRAAAHDSAPARAARARRVGRVRGRAELHVRSLLSLASARPRAFAHPCARAGGGSVGRARTELSYRRGEWAHRRRVAPARAARGDREATRGRPRDRCGDGRLRGVAHADHGAAPARARGDRAAEHPAGREVAGAESVAHSSHPRRPHAEAARAARREAHRLARGGASGLHRGASGVEQRSAGDVARRAHADSVRHARHRLAWARRLRLLQCRDARRLDGSAQFAAPVSEIVSRSDR